MRYVNCFSIKLGGKLGFTVLFDIVRITKISITQHSCLQMALKHLNLWSIQIDFCLWFEPEAENVKQVWIQIESEYEARMENKPSFGMENRTKVGCRQKSSVGSNIQDTPRQSILNIQYPTEIRVRQKLAPFSPAVSFLDHSSLLKLMLGSKLFFRWLIEGNFGKGEEFMQFRTSYCRVTWEIILKSIEKTIIKITLAERSDKDEVNKKARIGACHNGFRENLISLSLSFSRSKNCDSGRSYNFKITSTLFLLFLLSGKDSHRKGTKICLHTLKLLYSEVTRHGDKEDHFSLPVRRERI